MESNKSCYQPLKKYILDRIIATKSGTLKDDEISKNINNVKMLITVLGFETFNSTVLNLNSAYLNLTETEWENMQKELEKHFDVHMDIGAAIQGKNQQNRDLTWWTHNKKLNDSRFFSERYEQYISKNLSPGVVSSLDADTDAIVNNIGNPDDENFNIYGMVIGHVQSGKTMNYSSVICKAADAGYKFIVVITGTLNILRNQTQQRLAETFVGFDDKSNLIGVGEMSGASENKRPLVLTSANQDFDSRYAKLLTSSGFDDFSKPILLIIKKNVKTLKNLNNWIETMNKNSKLSKLPLLVIDDESDYASINTSGDNDDPTSINKGIRKLLSWFDKSSYVAYTATPYANILINHEDENDLFPRDFIYALKAPTDYCGPEKIFKDPEQKLLKFINVEELSEALPEKHKSDFKLDYLPEDLCEAVRAFYLNVAVRKLRHQDKQHNSMLIHISRFTKVHEQIRILVEDYSKNLSSDLISFIKVRNCELQSFNIRQIKELFDKDYSHLEFSWDQVKDALFQISNKIQVCGEYNGSKRRIIYPENVAANIIAVGGTSLARGFTLEGLSVSYFSRNTIFYDTLMQMARWFGYRRNYEDLCRVYIPETTADYFEHIYDSTTELIQMIDRMGEIKQTPEEFGLYIKKDPDNALQVTARNKQKNAADLVFSLNFSGKLKETLIAGRNKNNIDSNLNTIGKLIELLNSRNYNKTKKPNNLIWTNVPKENILKFIKDFEVPVDLTTSGISLMTREFIIDYIEKYNSLWDVAFFSGSGEVITKFNEEVKAQKRTVSFSSDTIKLHKNRRISSGDAEFIMLTEDEKAVAIKNSTPEKRSKSEELYKFVKKPLLMLHLIQPKEESAGYSENDARIIPAYGINFPGNINVEDNSYSIKANSVYMKTLTELMNDESGDDSDE